MDAASPRPKPAMPTALNNPLPSGNVALQLLVPWFEESLRKRRATAVPWFELKQPRGIARTASFPANPKARGEFVNRKVAI